MHRFFLTFLRIIELIYLSQFSLLSLCQVTKYTRRRRSTKSSDAQLAEREKMNPSRSKYVSCSLLQIPVVSLHWLLCISPDYSFGFCICREWVIPDLTVFKNVLKLPGANAVKVRLFFSPCWTCPRDIRGAKFRFIIHDFKCWKSCHICSLCGLPFQICQQPCLSDLYSVCKTCFLAMSNPDW